MLSASSAVKEYLDYLEIEKNRSPKTKDVYERALKRFIEFGLIARVSQITSSKIRDFRIHLAEKTDLKKVTQAYYVIAIRNFLRYLLKRGFDVPSPDEIELPAMPKRQIEIIEFRDLERLLAAPDGERLRALRDRAILETLFSTGLRVSELCALNRTLNLERGEISVRGKGEKLRLIFLSARAKKALAAYLDKRADAEDALFVCLSRTNPPRALGRIAPRAIQRLIQFYARKAGIPLRVTPHTLRHLFATDLLVNGADLRSVQELLGHANVQTTQIYTHLTNKELREVHRAFHARRRDE